MLLGKKKLTAETGAGQHGVALATAANYFGMECEIHMGEIDIAKEAPVGVNLMPWAFSRASSMTTT